MSTHPTRRQFLKLMGAGLTAASFPAISCTHKKSTPPNIVFILADDMGYGDLGCLNPESKIPTPNMDKIAFEGIHFTDAHSGSAVCTPTRYGILTGRYCWRTSLKRGVLWGYSPLLIDTNRLTVGKLLQQHGYYTGGIGKWHLGLGNLEKTDYSKPLTPGPNDVGFDYYFGIPASLDMDPYLFVENDHPVEQPTRRVDGKHDGGVFWRKGPIAPHFKFDEVLPTLTRKAVEFIETRAAGGSPFFLYLPLTAPHTPWVPTAEFQGTSKAGIYGDFVAQVDATVGQVMQALDARGIADNTLLIITSDNGSDERNIDPAYRHHANYIFRGQKSDVWDGGHRIPFLARWPQRIAANSSSDVTICLTDLLATAAAIVGADLPENAGEDSFNVLPALEGRPMPSPRPPMVHHSIRGMFAIRDGEWKLILGKDSGGWSSAKLNLPPDAPEVQLYQMKEDVRESVNVAEQHPDIVKRLTGLLEKFKRDGRSC